MISEEKKISPVRKMFDEIAGRYDFLNHALSGFRDVFWRRKGIQELFWERARYRESLKEKARALRILDLCGGTGDFLRTAQNFVKKKNWGKIDCSILGDFSFEMLKGAAPKKLSCHTLQIDALKTPFRAASFDILLNGFGMRNLTDARAGLLEANRILALGGEFLVLDFFSPRGRINTFFYRRIAPRFIPWAGKIFSGKREAYQYLIDSIHQFLSVDEFVLLAEESGFDCVKVSPCDFGIAFRVLLRKREEK